MIDQDRQNTSSHPFDLVYILDAIYHFQPAVPYFLATVLPTLRPGTGVIAYTDILPPSNLNAALGHLVLPIFLGVPARYVMQRPKDLDGYKRNLERIGFVDVIIQDWSEGVWEGLTRNLKGRGLIWRFIGGRIEAAQRGGCKYIAVKARRPQ